MFLMRMIYIDYHLAGIRPDESIYLQMTKSHLMKALRPGNVFLSDPLTPLEVMYTLTNWNKN